MASAVVEVAGEGGNNGQHVGDVAVFSIELSRPVIAPCPTRPSLEEQPFGSARQRALGILGAVHAVDGILDGRGFGNQPLFRFVPGANGKQHMERNGVPLHQRRDFPLLFFHHGQERELLLAGIVAGDSVVRLFFLGNFLANRQRVEIHRDRVIEQPQTGEPVDDSGIGRLRPAGQGDDGVVAPVHEKAEVGLAVAFGMPAILLNGQLRVESVNRVVIESVGQRRIEERLVMPIMVGILHRNDPRPLAGENARQHFVDVLKLRPQLRQKLLVILGQRRFGLNSPGRVSMRREM